MMQVQKTVTIGTFRHMTRGEFIDLVNLAVEELELDYGHDDKIRSATEKSVIGDFAARNHWATMDGDNGNSVMTQLANGGVDVEVLWYGDGGKRINEVTLDAKYVARKLGWEVG